MESEAAESSHNSNDGQRELHCFYFCAGVHPSSQHEHHILLIIPEPSHSGLHQFQEPCLCLHPPPHFSWRLQADHQKSQPLSFLKFFLFYFSATSCAASSLQYSFSSSPWTIFTCLSFYSQRSLAHPIQIQPKVDQMPSPVA